jgi:hypothetical protein
VSGVSSADVGGTGRTALLHRTFVVPAGAGYIYFLAAAVRPPECQPGPPLDITLEAAGGRFLPREVRAEDRWHPAPALVPLVQGRPREYRWAVSDLVGHTVRIVLHDGDDRAGCHLWCGGFRIASANDENARDFAGLMKQLAATHRLAPAERVTSRHFLAYSNGANEYARQRLHDCETIYPLFYEHFRGKGFDVREPGARLMVAIFDSQAGLEAYLGQQVTAALTGLYHRPSNRLVVYDYARNRSFEDRRRKGEEFSRQLRTDVERANFRGSLSRQADVRRADANVATIMHEVAHQLSFNSGLLNREGDVPSWLAEGLACYCESTSNGGWQGIGEPNALRAARLAGPAGGGTFFPLRSLVASDDWLRKASSVDNVLLGYSQSWALFRMLMEQRPRALRQYLASVYPRRTPERRLEDFALAFGTDLAKLEVHCQAYMRGLVRDQVRSDR